MPGDEDVDKKTIDIAPKELSKKLYAYVTQILGLKAYDVMHEAIFGYEDMTVEEASKLMDSSDAAELIVLSKDKKVIGIVTDRDIVRRVVSKSLDPKEVKLKDIMTKDVIVVLGEADLGLVAALMHKHNIRRIPVVNKMGKLLGIVDARDLANALGTQKEVLNKIVEGLEAQLTQIAKEIEEARKKEEEEKKEEAEKEKKLYG